MKLPTTMAPKRRRPSLPALGKIDLGKPVEELPQLKVPPHLELEPQLLKPVIPGLFIGPVGETNPDTLRLNNINTVITVMHYRPEIPEGIEHHYFELEDQADVPIQSIFEESGEIIHTALESGRNVLVHCYAGKSRSATTIMAFLMTRRGKTFEEAGALVGQARDVEINMGFLMTLKALAPQE